MPSVRFTPKCIVRCRDNDIDLSYRRRAGPRRLSLAGSKINETLFSLPHAVAEVMVAERENGGETERQGEIEMDKERNCVSRAAKGVSIALSPALARPRRTAVKHAVCVLFNSPRRKLDIHKASRE